MNVLWRACAVFKVIRSLNGVGPMQTLHALYIQNPFWVWLAVGAVFVFAFFTTGARA